MLLATYSPAAHAEKGDASLRIEYQFVRTGEFAGSFGDIDIGETDSHVLMLSGDYALSDRWTVSASLPYIRKRHQGRVTTQPSIGADRVSTGGSITLR